MSRFVLRGAYNQQLQAADRNMIPYALRNENRREAQQIQNGRRQREVFDGIYITEFGCIKRNRNIFDDRIHVSRSKFEQYRRGISLGLISNLIMIFVLVSYMQRVKLAKDCNRVIYYCYIVYFIIMAIKLVFNAAKFFKFKRPNIQLTRNMREDEIQKNLLVIEKMNLIEQLGLQFCIIILVAVGANLTQYEKRSSSCKFSPSIFILIVWVVVQALYYLLILISIITVYCSKHSSQV